MASKSTLKRITLNLKGDNPKLLDELCFYRGCMDHTGMINLLIAEAHQRHVVKYKPKPTFRQQAQLTAAAERAASRERWRAEVIMREGEDYYEHYSGRGVEFDDFHTLRVIAVLHDVGFVAVPMWRERLGDGTANLHTPSWAMHQRDATRGELEDFITATGLRDSPVEPFSPTVDATAPPEVQFGLDLMDE